MDEKERKASSDLFNLLPEVATERANQLELDEPPVILPEREPVH